MSQIPLGERGQSTSSAQGGAEHLSQAAGHILPGASTSGRSIWVLTRSCVCALQPVGAVTHPSHRYQPLSNPPHDQHHPRNRHKPHKTPRKSPPQRLLSGPDQQGSSCLAERRHDGTKPHFLRKNSKNVIKLCQPNRNRAREAPAS